MRRGEYEFDLSDTESSFYVPGIPAGVSVTRHYQDCAGGLLSTLLTMADTASFS